MIDTAPREMDYAAARRAMIDSQLRTSGVNEPFVLERMRDVRREDFVPADARGVCYNDRTIPLAGGGTLAQPVAHGKMLAEARPTLDDEVLVVENGSGYLAALVEPLAKTVLSVPIAEGVEGKAKGKFSLVLVDGAIEHCPPALAKKMKDDGRMVTGLVVNGVSRLAVGQRSGKGVAFLTVGDVALPRLAAFDKPKGWSF